MTIAFFITDTHEFYADMENLTAENGEFEWLSSRQIDIGRKSSFSVADESPCFESTAEAEVWLSENWPGGCHISSEEHGLDIDSQSGPTEAHYEDCARIAHEINEIAATAKLAEILPHEDDHTFLCQIGIWYWSNGHMNLAVMAYSRSIELEPEAPTYFNLSICLDDMNQTDKAQDTMSNFYRLVSSEEEKQHAEEILEKHGKGHLIANNAICKREKSALSRLLSCFGHKST